MASLDQKDLRTRDRLSALDQRRNQRLRLPDNLVLNQTLQSDEIRLIKQENEHTDMAELKQECLSSETSVVKAEIDVPSNTDSSNIREEKDERKETNLLTSLTYLRMPLPRYTMSNELILSREERENSKKEVNVERPCVRQLAIPTMPLTPRVRQRQRKRFNRYIRLKEGAAVRRALISVDTKLLPESASKRISRYGSKNAPERTAKDAPRESAKGMRKDATKNNSKRVAKTTDKADSKDEAKNSSKDVAKADCKDAAERSTPKHERLDAYRTYYNADESSRNRVRSRSQEISTQRNNADDVSSKYDDISDSDEDYDNRRDRNGSVDRNYATVCTESKSRGRPNHKRRYFQSYRFSHRNGKLSTRWRFHPDDDTRHKPNNSYHQEKEFDKNTRYRNLRNRQYNFRYRKGNDEASHSSNDGSDSDVRLFQNKNHSTKYRNTHRPCNFNHYDKSRREQRVNSEVGDETRQNSRYKHQRNGPSFDYFNSSVENEFRGNSDGSKDINQREEFGYYKSRSMLKSRYYNDVAYRSKVNITRSRNEARFQLQNMGRRIDFTSDNVSGDDDMQVEERCMSGFDDGDKTVTDEHRASISDNVTKESNHVIAMSPEGDEGLISIHRPSSFYNADDKQNRHKRTSRQSSRSNELRLRTPPKFYGISQEDNQPQVTENRSPDKTTSDDVRTSNPVEPIQFPDWFVKLFSSNVTIELEPLGGPHTRIDSTKRYKNIILNIDKLPINTLPNCDDNCFIVCERPFTDSPVCNLSESPKWATKPDKQFDQLQPKSEMEVDSASKGSVLTTKASEKGTPPEMTDSSATNFNFNNYKNVDNINEVIKPEMKGNLGYQSSDIASSFKHEGIWRKHPQDPRRGPFYQKGDDGTIDANKAVTAPGSINNMLSSLRNESLHHNSKSHTLSQTSSLDNSKIANTTTNLFRNQNSYEPSNNPFILSEYTSAKNSVSEFSYQPNNLPHTQPPWRSIFAGANQGFDSNLAEQRNTREMSPPASAPHSNHGIWTSTFRYQPGNQTGGLQWGSCFDGFRHANNAMPQFQNGACAGNSPLTQHHHTFTTLNDSKHGLGFPSTQNSNFMPWSFYFDGFRNAHNEHCSKSASQSIGANEDCPVFTNASENTNNSAFYQNDQSSLQTDTRQSPLVVHIDDLTDVQCCTQPFQRLHNRSDAHTLYLHSNSSSEINVNNSASTKSSTYLEYANNEISTMSHIEVDLYHHSVHYPSSRPQFNPFVASNESFGEFDDVNKHYHLDQWLDKMFVQTRGHNNRHFLEPLHFRKIRLDLHRFVRHEWRNNLNLSCIYGRADQEVKKQVDFNFTDTDSVELSSNQVGDTVSDSKPYSWSHICSNGYGKWIRDEETTSTSINNTLDVTQTFASTSFNNPTNVNIDSKIPSLWIHRPMTNQDACDISKDGKSTLKSYKRDSCRGQFVPRRYQQHSSESNQGVFSSQQDTSKDYEVDVNGSSASSNQVNQVRQDIYDATCNEEGSGATTEASCIANIEKECTPNDSILTHQYNEHASDVPIKSVTDRIQELEDNERVKEKLYPYSRDFHSKSRTPNNRPDNVHNSVSWDKETCGITSPIEYQHNSDGVNHAFKNGDRINDAPNDVVKLPADTCNNIDKSENHSPTISHTVTNSNIGENNQHTCPCLKQQAQPQLRAAGRYFSAVNDVNESTPKSALITSLAKLDMMNGKCPCSTSIQTPESTPRYEKPSSTHFDTHDQSTTNIGLCDPDKRYWQQNVASQSAREGTSNFTSHQTLDCTPKTGTYFGQRYMDTFDRVLSPDNRPSRYNGRKENLDAKCDSDCRTNTGSVCFKNPVFSSCDRRRHENGTERYPTPQYDGLERSTLHSAHNSCEPVRTMQHDNCHRCDNLEMRRPTLTNCEDNTLAKHYPNFARYLEPPGIRQYRSQCPNERLVNSGYSCKKQVSTNPSCLNDSCYTNDRNKMTDIYKGFLESVSQRSKHDDNGVASQNTNPMTMEDFMSFHLQFLSFIDRIYGCGKHQLPNTFNCQDTSLGYFTRTSARPATCLKTDAPDFTKADTEPFPYRRGTTQGVSTCTNTRLATTYGDQSYGSSSCKKADVDTEAERSVSPLSTTVVNKVMFNSSQRPIYPDNQNGPNELNGSVFRSQTEDNHTHQFEQKYDGNETNQVGKNIGSTCRQRFQEVQTCPSSSAKGYLHEQRSPSNLDNRNGTNNIINVNNQLRKSFDVSVQTINKDDISLNKDTAEEGEVERKTKLFSFERYPYYASHSGKPCNSSRKDQDSGLQVPKFATITKYSNQSTSTHCDSPIDTSKTQLATKESFSHSNSGTGAKRSLYYKHCNQNYAVNSSTDAGTNSRANNDIPFEFENRFGKSKEKESTRTPDCGYCDAKEETSPNSLTATFEICANTTSSDLSSSSGVCGHGSSFKDGRKQKMCDQRSKECVNPATQLPVSSNGYFGKQSSQTSKKSSNKSFSPNKSKFTSTIKPSFTSKDSQGNRQKSSAAKHSSKSANRKTIIQRRDIAAEDGEHDPTSASDKQRPPSPVIHIRYWKRRKGDSSDSKSDSASKYSRDMQLDKGLEVELTRVMKKSLEIQKQILSLQEGCGSSQKTTPGVLKDSATSTCDEDHSNSDCCCCCCTESLSEGNTNSNAKTSSVSKEGQGCSSQSSGTGSRTFLWKVDRGNVKAKTLMDYKNKHTATKCLKTKGSAKPLCDDLGDIVCKEPDDSGAIYIPLGKLTTSRLCKKVSPADKCTKTTGSEKTNPAMSDDESKAQDSVTLEDSGYIPLSNLNTLDGETSGSTANTRHVDSTLVDSRKYQHMGRHFQLDHVAFKNWTSSKGCSSQLSRFDYHNRKRPLKRYYTAYIKDTCKQQEGKGSTDSKIAAGNSNTFKSKIMQEFETDARRRRKSLAKFLKKPKLCKNAQSEDEQKPNQSSDGEANVTPLKEEPGQSTINSIDSTAVETETNSKKDSQKTESIDASNNSSLVNNLKASLQKIKLLRSMEKLCKEDLKAKIQSDPSLFITSLSNDLEPLAAVTVSSDDVSRKDECDKDTNKDHKDYDSPDAHKVANVISIEKRTTENCVQAGHSNNSLNASNPNLSRVSTSKSPRDQSRRTLYDQCMSSFQLWTIDREKIPTVFLSQMKRSKPKYNSNNGETVGRHGILGDFIPDVNNSDQTVESPANLKKSKIEQKQSKGSSFIPFTASEGNTMVKRIDKISEQLVANLKKRIAYLKLRNLNHLQSSSAQTMSKNGDASKMDDSKEGPNNENKMNGKRLLDDRETCQSINKKQHLQGDTACFNDNDVARPHPRTLLDEITQLKIAESKPCLAIKTTNSQSRLNSSKKLRRTEKQENPLPKRDGTNLKLSEHFSLAAKQSDEIESKNPNSDSNADNTPNNPLRNGFAKRPLLFNADPKLRSHKWGFLDTKSVEALLQIPKLSSSSPFVDAPSLLGHPNRMSKHSMQPKHPESRGAEACHVNPFLPPLNSRRTTQEGSAYSRTETSLESFSSTCTMSSTYATLQKPSKSTNHSTQQTSLIPKISRQRTLPSVSPVAENSTISSLNANTSQNSLQTVDPSTITDQPTPIVHSPSVINALKNESDIEDTFLQRVTKWYWKIPKKKEQQDDEKKINGKNKESNHNTDQPAFSKNLNSTVMARPETCKTKQTDHTRSPLFALESVIEASNVTFAATPSKAATHIKGDDTKDYYRRDSLSKTRRNRVRERTRWRNVRRLPDRGETFKNERPRRNSVTFSTPSTDRSTTGDKMAHNSERKHLNSKQGDTLLSRLDCKYPKESNIPSSLDCTFPKQMFREYFKEIMPRQTRHRQHNRNNEGWPYLRQLEIGNYRSSSNHGSPLVGMGHVTESSQSLVVLEGTFLTIPESRLEDELPFQLNKEMSESEVMPFRIEFVKGGYRLEYADKTASDSIVSVNGTYRRWQPGSREGESKVWAFHNLLC